MNPVPQPAALYIHIPFCAARCPYCDFNTYAGLEALYEPYTAALAAEIRGAGARHARPQLASVFIGGGTPTVLPAPLLEQIVRACEEAFAILPDAEITSEANPGAVDRERFRVLRQLGVNRLSMGVQSFDDQELRWLGRIHGADEAEAAYWAAREAGFDNINLDFMFGLPGQAPATWRRTLARAVALQPEHLSLYSLTVEKGTPLGQAVLRGATPAPDDDLAADQYTHAAQYLAGVGYHHYEISNWARDGAREEGSAATTGQHPPNPGFASRHNLVYWHAEPYLGCGAGAHSYVGGRRVWNVRRVPTYVGRITSGRDAVAGHEPIGETLAQGEMMMLGLRLLIEGVPFGRFRSRFGIEALDVFGPEIRALLAQGLLELLPDRVRLTTAGRLLGNQVFLQFLPDA